MKLFDTELYKKRLEKTVIPADHFLIDEIKSSILERIQFLGGPFQSTAIENFPYITTDSVAPCDLLVSVGVMHHIDDVEIYMKEQKERLKEGGYFMGIFPGGESLKELRIAMQKCDEELLGGFAPRVIPMIDVKDAARILQHAGFKMVISDVDEITVNFGTVHKLLQFIQQFGQNNCLVKRDRRPLPKLYLQKLNKLYKTEFGAISMTLEIITVLGKK